MNSITKDFLKFIVNNKGLLDKETLNIITTENIIIRLNKDKYELELVGCNRFIESNELVHLNYDDCRYEFSSNFKKLFFDSLISDTSKISYSEQLKHDLWKQKRNFIIKQRGNKCERCTNTENLQVHHIKYIKGRLAWEYDDDLLECLCGNCHMKEHKIDKNKKVTNFGLKEYKLDELSNILKLRTLIAINLKSEVVNYLMATCEVMKITDKSIRFNIHPTYHKYLRKNFNYCIKFNWDSVDFIIDKAVINNNLFDFTHKQEKIL